ncbi:hypothetical protein HOL34_03950 [bacterium]|mgnify:CR=1 FL=1|jgi:hypothetical protein|nr:hypothetical protein [bacterium]MBT3903241.1 hypothetical protein [bacterium]MBT4578135.1 hypothetical protein [bacterium]MBT5345565.1 hypothetical protein [bacterium]MBT6131076.1 hypothetical protein [bacterium]
MRKNLLAAVLAASVSIIPQTKPVPQFVEDIGMISTGIGGTVANIYAIIKETEWAFSLDKKRSELSSFLIAGGVVCLCAGQVAANVLGVSWLLKVREQRRFDRLSNYQALEEVDTYLHNAYEKYNYILQTYAQLCSASNNLGPADANRNLVACVQGPLMTVAPDLIEKMQRLVQYQGFLQKRLENGRIVRTDNLFNTYQAIIAKLGNLASVLAPIHRAIVQSQAYQMEQMQAQLAHMSSQMAQSNLYSFHNLINGRR